ncbi:MAG: winged helix-turn-helix domain-containing protein [Thermoproteota archaeon]
MYESSEEIIGLIEEISSSVSGSRIFWKLFKNGEMSLSEIIRQTNLNHKIVRRNIEIMVEKGLIREKIFGRLKIYVLNQENKRVRMLLNLIKQASYEPPPQG